MVVLARIESQLIKKQFSNTSGRKRSNARTYCFQPSILSTNKAIRKEAFDIFVKNHFVVVSYKWELVEKLLHSFSLPIVTENQAHIARFRHSVLRIHVKAPPVEVVRGTKVKSFLMVANDLPALHAFLQHTFYYICSPAHLMVDNDEMGDSWIFESEPGTDTLPTLTCRFQDTGPAVLTTDQIKTVLDGFKKVLLGKQQAYFQNVPTPLWQDAVAVRRAMSPPTIWLTAMGWQIYEAAQGLKATADELCQAGHYTQASAKYSMIWTLATRAHIFDAPPESFKSTFRHAAIALYAVVFGALITDGFLCLRKNINETAATGRMEKTNLLRGLIHKVETEIPDPLRSAMLDMFTKSQGRDMSIWLVTLHTFLYPEDQARESVSASMAKMQRLKAMFPDSAHFARDYEAVRGPVFDHPVCTFRLHLPNRTDILLGLLCVPPWDHPTDRTAPRAVLLARSPALDPQHPVAGWTHQATWAGRLR